MKVVVDANVFVSALLSGRGAPKQIIDLWREEAFELLTSAEILNEIERVLNYPKIAQLHKLSTAELQEFVTLLRDESTVITPTQRLAISPDESDNRYIECAVAGSADYLVTGDKQHLLPIGEYHGVPILPRPLFWRCWVWRGEVVIWFRY